MSRRITLCVLVTSTSLIATQASADRECFEDMCRLPEVVEQPAQVTPAPATEEVVAREKAAPIMAQKLAPANPHTGAAAGGLQPQQVPAQEHAAEAREPARLAPHYAGETREAARALHIER